MDIPETRTKIPYRSDDHVTCPSCGFKQKKRAGGGECESCGIVFSKHLSFTPIKAALNKFVSTREIAEIRDTQERFTNIKHDVSSKMELIVHCQKEKLLDMAAHHLKKEDDRAGLEAIKKLATNIYTEEKNDTVSKMLELFSRPLILVPAALFIFLLIMTLLLRSYL
jgi:ribosomal protein L37AE/L43A